MKLFKGLSFAISLCGALLLTPSCGGSSTSDGTDSNTHWLEDCETDRDCGSLSCICGECSKPCEVGADCQAFGASAVCGVATGCGKLATSACVREGGSSGSGGSDAAGGSGSSEGGTSQTLPDPECPAMDAHTGTLACGTVVGYAFDGKICAPVLCSCEGSECDSLYETADECDSAYKVCYAKYGVQRACTSNADCATRYRTCCSPCSAESVDAFVGTTRSSPFLEDIGMCVGDPDPDRECGKCTPLPNPAIYGVCLEGECRPIDMSDQAQCQTSADCKLVSGECCDDDCSAGWPGMSLNVKTTTLPYCPPNDCLLCTYEQGQQYGSICNTEVGKCEMFITTL
jgi:hypothetical protein